MRNVDGIYWPRSGRRGLSRRLQAADLATVGIKHREQWRVDHFVDCDDVDSQVDVSIHVGAVEREA